MAPAQWLLNLGKKIKEQGMKDHVSKPKVCTTKI